MPNWVFQDLHVVGSQAEIDRFFETRFIPKKKGEIDDVLDFTRLCPLRSRERKDTYTHESGVVLKHFRTRAQALFSMITSWDYPAEFYKRLPKHWPELAFCCSMNEDMEQFGGVLVVMDGAHVSHVRAYDADYDSRSHGRDVKALLKRWFERLTADRDWRLMADTGRRLSVPFDAHFDDDRRFYFRTRDDLARFKRRYKAGAVMRRDGRTWRSARVPLIGAR
jgi:hypothetical protein